MGDSDDSVSCTVGDILHRRLRRWLWDAGAHLLQATNPALAVTRNAGRCLEDGVRWNPGAGHDRVDMDAGRLDQMAVWYLSQINCVHRS